MAKILLPLLLALCVLSTYGRIQTEEKPLTREQAIEDIDFMIEYIISTHPNMFAVYPENDFYREVEKVKSSLPERMGYDEFFRHAGTLIPILGDGHTFWLPPGYRTSDTAKRLVFPYSADFFWPESGPEMYINDKRVLSINGIPVEDMCNNMIRYVSGESPVYRLRSRIGQAFPIYMSVLYPAKEYKIVYDTEIRHSKETVRPIVMDAAMQMQLGRRDTNYYNYTIREDISTCILDFKSFQDRDKFTKLLERMFTEMKQKSITNLIIDIRKNGGGDSQLGDQLAEYISPVPFRQFGNTTVKHSKYLREAYPNWDLIKTDTVIHYTEPPVNELPPLSENSLRYSEQGKAYLLTSVNTFSSATDFAWTFQYFGMGSVIGEETGGYIVTFGDVISKTLPNSPMIVGCSWKKFYCYGSTDEDTHGVIPDYAVAADKALDFTINELILKK